MKIMDSVKGLAANDKAQALAEFVLVVPVMILVFLLIIQHLIIVQASLVGNYAAYAACRVYAVRASIDADDAREKALMTAALVYAPVSRMMPGEIGPPAGSPNSYLPASAQGALDTVAPVGFAAALAEGYVVARYVRLNESVSGGNVKIGSAGSPEEVTVEINYAQPVLIPGLAELWKLTGAGRDIVDDLSPISERLDGSSVAGLAGLYPSIIVGSKCAMGKEDWGSDAEKYRPRRRKTVESEEATNPELEENAREQQKAREACEASHRKMLRKADELKQAQDRLDSAKAEYDEVMADPRSTDGQKQAAEDKVLKATLERNQKQDAYDNARDDYALKKRRLDELAGMKV